MADKSKTDDRDEARRKFLKCAGQVAMTTPAVTLLLSAGTKSGVRAGAISALTEDQTANGPFGLDNGIDPAKG